VSSRLLTILHHQQQISEAIARMRPNRPNNAQTNQLAEHHHDMNAPQQQTIREQTLCTCSASVRLRGASVRGMRRLGVWFVYLRSEPLFCSSCVVSHVGQVQRHMCWLICSIKGGGCGVCASFQSPTLQYIRKPLLLVQLPRCQCTLLVSTLCRELVSCLVTPVCWV
jgi:hypothetical protein